MKEGLYKVTFSSPIGSGRGVVHIRDGLVRGGDAFMYYTGTYTVDGDKLNAHVQIVRHSRAEGDWGQSILGKDDISAHFIGIIRGDEILAQGKSAAAPGASVNALFNLISD